MSRSSYGLIFCTFLTIVPPNITLWSKPDLSTSAFLCKCGKRGVLELRSTNNFKWIFNCEIRLFFSKMNWDRVSCYMEHYSVGFFWCVSLDARILSLIENRNKGNVIHRFIQLEKKRENWLCHPLSFWLRMCKGLCACLRSNHIKVQNV